MSLGIGEKMKYDILVNKKNPLMKDYVPKNLVFTKSKIKPFVSQESDHLLVEEVLVQFNKLKEEALLSGYAIEISSGYRSYEYQEEVLKHYLDIHGERVYDFVALPGTSEHQTGYALDFLPYRKKRRSEMTEYEINQFDLLEKEIYQWVEKNAHLYGFIIRYPISEDNDLEKPHHITGYKYEPWHLRYVGIDIAKYIFKNKLTLEEYKKLQEINIQ